MASAKTHNRANAVHAKQQLRRNILAELRPARVFDAFCGPKRGGSSDAWDRADSYVGCDTVWRPDDTRRRFVGDNRRILRSVDLAGYNVFDLDAFGSPWEQALIVAARREWKRNERGALVLTDGSSMNTRFGNLPAALAQLLGAEKLRRLAPGAGSADAYQRMALRRWCQLSNVRPLKQWRADSASSGVGSCRMVYTAILFEGLGGVST